MGARAQAWPCWKGDDQDLGALYVSARSWLAAARYPPRAVRGQSGPTLAATLVAPAAGLG